MIKYIFSHTLTISLFSLTIFAASSASAIFVDGEGHYSLSGETRTHPGFKATGGYHQAINQNFRLNTEIRTNDRSSFNLEFKIFDSPRSAFLGDQSRPGECSPLNDPDDKSKGTSNTGNTSDAVGCDDRPQNSLEPRYAPYIPKISKAYIQYAIDHCLVTAGRRGRDWGLGMILNSGTGSFDTDSTVYDGIDCNISIYKSQTLGVSFGYDKITETGTNVAIDSTDTNSTCSAYSCSRRCSRSFSFSCSRSSSS